MDGLFNNLLPNDPHKGHTVSYTN